MQRIVYALAHDLRVYLSQQDGRPVSGSLLRHIRDYGVRCYLAGQESQQSDAWRRQSTAPTLPAPAKEDDE